MQRGRKMKVRKTRLGWGVAKKRLALCIAIAVTASLAVAGCAATEPEAAPGGDRTYVKWVTNGDPMGTGLNAQFASGNSATTFSSQILEPLIFASGDGKLSPGLAKSWELSGDGLKLTLEIRKGVTWHDGKPFTAKDVQFNFQEIVPLAILGAEITKRISAVKIVGDSTVTIELEKPFGPFLETVAEQYMLPKHLYEGTDYVTNSANNEGIVGTGPMKFGTYTPGVEIMLVKNPDYWGGKVQVDRAFFVQIADINTRQEALFAGELDESQVSASALKRVMDDKNTELRLEGYYPSLIHMFFNTRSQYLSDPAVRAAVFSALDRDKIVKTAMYGIGGKAANGFVPESYDWAVNKKVDFAANFRRDIKAINTTLDKAGFPVGADGKRFTLRIRYVQSLQDLVTTGDMMKSMLDEVGIGLEILGTSSQIYLEGLYKTHDYDLAITRQTLGPEPSVGLTRWFACNKTDELNANPTGMCDPEIEAALDLALGATDQAERGKHYKKVQERAEKLMFYVPLYWYYNANPAVNTSRWTGVAPKEYRERLSWTTMTPVS